MNYPPLLLFSFICITFGTLFFIFKAFNSAWLLCALLAAWLLLQAALAYYGFYLVTNAFPPRFLAALLPPFLLVLIFVTGSRGTELMKKIDYRWLVLLHTLRIFVEFCLFSLYLVGAVPELMTFEGRNLDILSGISAPFVYYFVFVKQKISRNLFLTWNILCLLLLINVFVNALLSVPTPLQQFAFKQPNTAVLHFPFIWLPSFVVPIVLFSHLLCIRASMEGNLRVWLSHHAD